MDKINFDDLLSNMKFPLFEIPHFDDSNIKMFEGKDYANEANKSLEKLQHIKPNPIYQNIEIAIKDLQQNQAVLFAMVKTLFNVMTLDQQAEYMELYDRILTESQMKIVSSNPPKENNPK